MKKISCILLLLLIIKISPAKAQGPVSHDPFTRLLKEHVAQNGKVNYKGLLKDSSQLNAYLGQLRANPPQNNWSRNEQLAYWINAYNAFTLQLVMRNYPVKSIKDIGSRLQIPFVNTPWDIKFIQIGQKTYDLNNIEHDILRKKFNEPRIHFAIVCASVSCPKLLNEAYVGARLDQQLTAQARSFINDGTRNKITPDNAQLSSIFNWFKGDFTKNNSLIAFINQYASPKLQKNARISYLDYNWNLNE